MTDKARMEAENPYKDIPKQLGRWDPEAIWDIGYQKCLDTVVAELREELRVEVEHHTEEIQANGKLRAENTKLREALRKLRRDHYQNDADCWYSCPKSAEGCCDENAGNECNCGADEHNAIIDQALTTEPEEWPCSGCGTYFPLTEAKCPHCHKPVRIAK